ncbi:DUF2127 domain-containing protein [Dyella sp.]|jgi:uncharacterized membrane protein (DUF2068 family)|uniref:DUF2127 domain-containing protein n=1 Tax=Dyella sp. TaxID=1869338 RepID=UPI002B5FAC0A|nr:DUF2127 domain-containing protein [Dyella sp.]HTC26894.1 DUF2127 domain-containing protein [Dyella sp.]
MSPSEHRLTKPSTDIEQQHSVGLRVIAIYKGIKTIGLIILAFMAFGLHREKTFDHLIDILEHLSLTDTNGLRWQLVEMLENLGPTKFVAIGIVALVYAAIFATEGTGLWLRKHWAEWFTVIATGSLIPVEIYEVFHRFTWLKLAALIANVVIVLYLIRLASQPHARRSNDSASKSTRTQEG